MQYQPREPSKWVVKLLDKLTFQGHSRQEEGFVEAMWQLFRCGPWHDR